MAYSIKKKPMASGKDPYVILSESENQIEEDANTPYKNES
jgi:hypothetical protein